MRKEPRPMREIHKIQERIYSEQKDMTDKEKIEAIKREVKQAKDKLGFRVRKVHRKAS